MMGKCPGKMMPRDLDSVLVPCPACGRLVEFFTDEAKRTCRCGNVLLRESLPRCAEWCPAAAQCLGEAIDVRELERRLAQVRDDPRAKRCLEDVRRRLRSQGNADKSE